MNVLEMLQMYLEDHNISCWIDPERVAQYSNFTKKAKLKVSLKYMDISENISLAIGHVDLTFDGVTITGDPPGKFPTFGQSVRKEASLSVILADPESFEKVRKWIHKHEDAIKASTGFQHALSKIGAMPNIQQDISKAIHEDFRNGAIEALMRNTKSEETEDQAG